MLPLVAAQYAIKKSLPGLELRVEQGMIFFGFSSKLDGEPLEGIIENYHTKDALKVGVMPDVAMRSWRTCELYFISLARQLEPFLAGRYGRAGYLQLYDHGQVMRVAYEAPVFYSALDDDELQEAISTAFTRALRATVLLRPVFSRMVKTSRTLTSTESFNIIEREHAELEMKGFTDCVEDKYAHLPQGLYENLYPRDVTRHH